MADIAPALTPEEWSAERVSRSVGVNYSWAVAHGVYMDGYCERPHTHGLAAACLADEPFGFTWEDVEDELVDAAEWDAQASLSEAGAAADDLHRKNGINARARADRCRSRASRIAALLPPRKEKP